MFPGIETEKEMNRVLANTLTERTSRGGKILFSARNVTYAVLFFFREILMFV